MNKAYLLPLLLLPSLAMADCWNNGQEVVCATNAEANQYNHERFMEQSQRNHEAFIEEQERQRLLNRIERLEQQQQPQYEQQQSGSACAGKTGRERIFCQLGNGG